MASGSPSLAGISALVAHPWMGSGGSEATTMWAIQALQEAAMRVTLVTASDFEVESFNQTYGTRVDPAALTVSSVRRLPGTRSGGDLAHWQNGWFQRQCRLLASDFDLCVSGYNLVDFARPGIQLIGDYTWHEGLRRELDPDSDRLPRHRDHWIRQAYLKIGDWLRADHHRPLADRRDLVLANSDWTREILEAHFRLSPCPVLFPPVIYEPDPGTSSDHRDPLAFACLGRICPEKRIESIIRILARVREAGLPVTLVVAGSADDVRYGDSVKALAREAGDWIRFPGFLRAQERDSLLARCSYGIHARPAEAFGIAVAEMAGSGCLPFVPDCGGPAEIVSVPELRFENEEDAVERILAVLRSTPEEIALLRDSVAASVERFRPEHFMTRFRKQVIGFLDGEHSSTGSGQPHHRPSRDASTGQRKAASTSP